MQFPNLLASKSGRLTAFFALYMTEGIPLGFTATAIATHMRRQGLDTAEIGMFVGTLYLPWAFKFLAGPFVDVFSSDRFGRRRVWIVGTQILMVLALMAALPVNFTTELTLFTIVILIHNCFCATQDVAIDALACSVLKKEERGLANGLMFGGAYIGQMIGGAGVLKLIPYTGLPATYFFVSAVILAVTVFIALPLREPKRPPRAAGDAEGLNTAARELRQFGRDALTAFTSSRAALIGLVVALLPAGAYGLGLALQSNLAVELGLPDSRIADLALFSTIISGAGCIAGGWLSDKFGRRRMLGTFIASMTFPTLYLAWVMLDHQWIMPVDTTLPDRPMASGELLNTFWITCLVYSLCNGLMYGARSALFMDVTTPAVAATQFTAYMSCLNLVISYSAAWQGYSIKHFGYPLTLLVDGLIGLACLALLPLMTTAKNARRGEDAKPPSA